MIIQGENRPYLTTLYFYQGPFLSVFELYRNHNSKTRPTHLQ